VPRAPTEEVCNGEANIFVRLCNDLSDGAESSEQSEEEIASSDTKGNEEFVETNTTDNAVVNELGGLWCPA
jgi:hypothetical protein